MIFLTSNSFFLCWLAMSGSFHPFWSLSQRMGHALLLCPYFRDLLTAWKNLILLMAHFGFFLVRIPVFRVVLFEVKHTWGGFFGLCCSCGGTELKYITVTVTGQRFHCEILNQILHITQDTNKLSLSEVCLFWELISGPLSALPLCQLSHRSMAPLEDLHVGLAEMGLREFNCYFL